MKRLNLKIDGLQIDVYDKSLIRSIPMDKTVVGQELFDLVQKRRPQKLILHLSKEFMNWIPYFNHLDFRVVNESKQAYIMHKTVEWFDSYDEDLNRLEGEMIRGLPGERGHHHLVVEVLTLNENNQFLVTKRAREKAMFPMYYEVTGGSVLKGESILDAALRELKEETGLKANLEDLVIMRKDIDLDTIYISILNRGPYAKKPIKLQKGETMDYLWIPHTEFIKFIKGHYFVEYITERILKYFSQITFETKSDQPSLESKDSTEKKTLLEVMNSKK